MTTSMNFASLTEMAYFRLVNVRNQMTMMQALVSSQRSDSLTMTCDELESFFDLQSDLLSDVIDLLDERSASGRQRMSPRHWEALITSLCGRRINADAGNDITARLEAEAALDGEFKPVMQAWLDAWQAPPKEAVPPGAEPSTKPSARKRAKLAPAHA